jgi:transposase-like protein
MMELSYRRHRFPPVVIQHAVWLYLRFTLSYGDVEDPKPFRDFVDLGGVRS